MPTPKREVRIPEDLWRDTMRKAGLQGTSAAGVIKILLAEYMTGHFDALVRRGVIEARSASTVGGQQTSQDEPPASSTG